MSTITRPRKALAVLSALALLGLSACGSDEPDSTLADGWDNIVAAAKDEGKVTIYSGQGQTQLDALAAAFEDEYGIEVEVVRGIDSELAPKIEAEKQTGKQVADVYVSSQEAAQEAYDKQGYYEKPQGPDFEGLDNMVGDDVFKTNATILTYAWNTDQYAKGLTSYADLLDPALKGKIGVPEPSNPTFVDFYLYLQELNGDDFLDKLAAQEPKIYAGALPAAEALSSGEISAAAYVEPQVDQQEAGAPVDFGFDDPRFAAVFYGSIVADGPHPNAAQLLADFMMTPDGQAQIARKGAALLPDVPGTFGDFATIRPIDALDDEQVTEFQGKWNALFR